MDSKKWFLNFTQGCLWSLNRNEYNTLFMIGPNFVIGFIGNWYLSCIKVSFAVNLVDGN